ncbi:MAG: acetyl-CoA hydrolase/transferase C-terminal domain-containing protein [Phenylobacterium sp.]|uniref:acetyl-CoA hydrolase/transferase C-terminal domain-containing protein n=1 Tax=Phenylobacterium sp. TaxID=1871053 RepID=UPI00273685CE|nr:acetyl-CoA hydrolase/transferase C-terminal domain-containing protein [Phenylobacterium sp.]MDP3748821.1 acetyl-CoA hydrolase/transferase C-terminal domain-containing protein [Phenylobacterium sp.]
MAASVRRDLVSRPIHWSYGYTMVPSHLRDIVVTEYGVADLRDRPDADVIAAMLSIADNRFQADLLARAKAAGKIDKGYEIPAAFRDNRPERIERALAPAREAGLLTTFPFGCEFTDVEQRLLPAPQALRGATGSAPRLARLAARGLTGRRGSPETEEALHRLGLDRPGSLREHGLRALVRGALAA